MFDISWTEFLLIGIVALIAIGPKELPGVLRTAGQYMGKVRRMAAEFQGQFQEAMREAEMADLKKEVDAIKDSASGLASDLNKATSLDPTAPTAASDPIPAGPPPPLAETLPDGTVPLPAPAEQQALPAPEAAPLEPAPPAAPPEAAPPAAPPAAVDLNIPLPEPLPPVTEKDFAAASAASSVPAASAPNPKEGGA